MRKFETLLLLSPELSADARDGILNDLKAIVEREKGTMEDIDQWGMRDLAYPVHKVMRGFYVRLVYAGPSELVAELERNIRIKDGIFKYMTVRLAEDAEAGEVAYWPSGKGLLRAVSSAVSALIRISPLITSVRTSSAIS